MLAHRFGGKISADLVYPEVRDLLVDLFAEGEASSRRNWSAIPVQQSPPLLCPALGAAAASQQSSVEMLVFVAIMLHKAPAAFGLASYLIHNGVPLEGGTCT